MKLKQNKKKNLFVTTVYNKKQKLSSGKHINKIKSQQLAIKIVYYYY